MSKKLNKIDVQIAAINKEISKLKVQPVVIIKVLQNIMAEMFVKNCKKCSFSATKKKP